MGRRLRAAGMTAAVAAAREVEVTRLDPESAEWVASLVATGASQKPALARLHGLVVRVASAEVRRRAAVGGLAGAEESDLAHRAADDAMLAILSKIESFRGESRFTTWAYRFVVLEVSNQLGRHYRAHAAIHWEAEDWDELPARLDAEPGSYAEQAELVAEVRRAVDGALTDHQRRAFVAIVLNGVPVDAAVGELGPNRNAIYKTVFEARVRIRRQLVSSGFLLPDAAGGRS